MAKTIVKISKQNGATLVVALIVLVVLMILGVAAVMSANTQSKMAGNLQFENMAKNRAENQMARAEADLNINGGANALLTWTPAYLIDSAPPLAPIAAPEKQVMVRGNIDPANPGDGYLIELLARDKSPAGESTTVTPTPGVCSKSNVYLITARGASLRGAVRYVQAVYQVLSC